MTTLFLFKLRFIYFIILSFVLSSALTNAQEIVLPPGGKIISGENIGYSAIIPVLRTYDDTLINKTSTYRVPDKKNTSDEFTANFRISESIAKGDLLVWSFHIRTLWSENESGDGKIRLDLKHPDIYAPEDIALTVTAGEHWRHVVQPFRAQAYMNMEDAFISLNLGFGAQEIELSPIRLLNFGSRVDASIIPYIKTSYEGRSIDSPWRKEAEQRIDKHRKSDLDIKVVNKKGKNIRGAQVEINMLKHSFGFGTATHYDYLLGEEQDNERYREYFLKYFNKTATERGLRWENWFNLKAEEQKKLRYEMDTMFSWFSQHNIPVRGHHLIWAKIDDRKQPLHLKGDIESITSEYFQFQSWLMDWVGNRVTEWDAINHIAGDQAGPGKTYADYYGFEIWADVIRKARLTTPGVEMWVNEGAIIPMGRRIDKYLEIIEFLNQNNASPDGIGFMAHFRESSLTPIDEVYKRMDLFAEKVPSLQLTEFDVEVGKDEELQADYFRDILTISFSHPAMKGIVLWGFWEGRHWRPDAALWRKDWSIKPAGQAWIDLIYDEWWSNEKGTSDSEGRFSSRIFHGEHEVIVKYKGKETRQIINISEDKEITVNIE